MNYARVQLEPLLPPAPAQDVVSMPRISAVKWLRH